MAPTDNVPSFCPQESNNLLSFVSSATVDIHSALGKQTKKRTVNIRKYVKNRVKRLDQGKGRRGAQAPLTKSKSAQLSAPSAKKQQQVIAPARPHASLESSNSCPELSLPPAMPPTQPRTFAAATTNFPTYTSSHPSMQYSYSESSLHPPTSVAGFDDYLAALLDELPQQPAMSSRHTSDSVTPCLTPQPTLDLEAQVGLAEHPYSPYSDCYSDELYGDSAYSSHNCSPVATSTCAMTSAADWTSVHSLPLAMPQCSVAYSASGYPSSLPLTTGCSWMQADCPLTTVNAPMPAVFDQGPPATPTVEQVLSEWGSYQ